MVRIDDVTNAVAFFDRTDVHIDDWLRLLPRARPTSGCIVPDWRVGQSQLGESVVEGGEVTMCGADVA